MILHEFIEIQLKDILKTARTDWVLNTQLSGVQLQFTTRAVSFTHSKKAV